MATMKNRMTLDDVLFDLRSRGVSMSKGDLAELIANGTFPFGTVTRNTKPNGEPSLRRNFLIFGKDYALWVNEYFPRGGFDEDAVKEFWSPGINVKEPPVRVLLAQKQKEKKTKRKEVD